MRTSDNERAGGKPQADEQRQGMDEADHHHDLQAHGRRFLCHWCGPCKQLAPILDEIENNHKGEVIFQRIDVDQKPELAQEFNIQAIPMLMFITPRGEYQTLVGQQEPLQ